MFLHLCAVSMLFGSIQTLTRDEANEYMDRVLNGDRFAEEAKYNRLDPYKMDDIKVTLNQTATQAGKAVLSKGQLQHLSKVRRSTDCTVPFFQSANITFTCFLRFDDLEVSYIVNATHDNKELSFNAVANIDGTNLTVQITSNREDDIPNLKLIFINRIGYTTVTWEVSTIHLETALLIGRPIREALERKTLQTLHQAIGGRFKSALAYSIYKTPIGLDK